MTKLTSKSDSAEEGGALAALVGKRFWYFNQPEVQIIEDSILFNPKATLDILRKEGMHVGMITGMLVRMQSRFPRYDEELERWLDSSHAPITEVDVTAIQIMLRHATFFTHELHEQSHLLASDYRMAARNLEATFQTEIPDYE